MQRSFGRPLRCFERLRGFPGSGAHVHRVHRVHGGVCFLAAPNRIGLGHVYGVVDRRSIVTATKTHASSGADGAARCKAYARPPSHLPPGGCKRRLHVIFLVI